MDVVKRTENYPSVEECHTLYSGKEEIKIISKDGKTHMFIDGVEVKNAVSVYFSHNVHNEIGAVLNYTTHRFEC